MKTNKEFFDDLKMTSDILKHLLIWKEWEKPIKEALKKSAKSLLKECDCKDISEIEPETALLNIINAYLE